MNGQQVDPVIREIVRDQALGALDRVPERAALETAWAILNLGQPATLNLDDAAARIQIRSCVQDDATPHRLVYETWVTFRDALEPPAAVQADLSGIVDRLNSLFGIRRRPQISS